MQSYFLHILVYFFNHSYYWLCHRKDSSLHVGEITSSSSREGIYSEIFFNCTLAGIKALRYIRPG